MIMRTNLEKHGTSQAWMPWILLVAAVSHPFAHGQATERVSIATDGTQGNADSGSGAVSADGRFVAFQSYASNLVPLDTNGVRDIFVRDRLDGTTERVSVSSNGTQSNQLSVNPSISADGRFVAFESFASNLIGGDSNGYDDVFVRDRQTGTTELISVSTGGEQGNSSSGVFGLAISADGRYVAFQSTARNLIADDKNEFSAVFVRDRSSDTTELVSRSIGGGQGNAASGYYGVSISADGRFVAFDSSASNLVRGDTNGRRDVFVRDRAVGSTRRVSVSTVGVQGNLESWKPTISANGRYVAYGSLASNLVTGDTNGTGDVFLRDLVGRTTERMSLGTGGVQANGNSGSADMFCTISADGRYVAFDSLASNLAPGDTNGVIDVYVRDRQDCGSTERISISTSGGTGNATSHAPAMSADGRFVALESYATNLVPDDTNNARDVFVRDLATPGYDFGYVYLGAPSIPMQSVLIEILGTNPPVFTSTDCDGRYVVPNVQGAHGIRASITYVEPATDIQSQEIRNYPLSDPSYEHVFGTGIANRIDDIVYPWPVLLQAGWTGLALPYGSGAGAHAWDGFRAFMEKDPADKADGVPAFLCFPMPSTSDPDHAADGYDNFGLFLDGPNRGHSWSAIQLKKWWDVKVLTVLSSASLTPGWVRPDRLSAVKTSIVCHSMGGLITRAFATTYSSPAINRIVSLDGTHGGSFLSVLSPLAGLWPVGLNGLTLGCPGSIFLLQPWNRAYTDLNRPDRWLLYECAPDPTVIPDVVFGSAMGYGWSVGLDALPRIRFCAPSQINQWVDGVRVQRLLTHTGIVENPQVQEECARFLHLGQRPSGSHLTTSSPLGMTLEGRVGGSVQATPGGSSQVNLQFDANDVVTGEVLWSGGGSQYNLTTPSGPVQLSDLVSVPQEGGSFLDTFTMQPPPVGAVTVSLVGAPSESTTLSYSFAFDNGRSVSLEVDPVALAANQPTQIRAALVDASGNIVVPTGAGAVTADVESPEGILQTIDLFDDGLHGDGAAGDGVFGELFGMTFLEGRYRIACRMSIPQFGEVIDRGEAGEFHVLPTGASFSALPVEITPDVDGDGLFDSLSFSQSVTFNRTGNFRLVGSLLDSNGALITTVQSNFENSVGPGTAVITLVALGTGIRIHGMDGPWTLSGLTLYDLDSGALPCAVAADYATQAYSVSAFQTPESASIHRLLPDSGSWIGGDLVVIQGSGLGQTSSVQIGTTPASFVVLDDDTLEVVVPHAAAGPRKRRAPLGSPFLPPTLSVDVRVVTPWGADVLSNGYTYR